MSHKDNLRSIGREKAIELGQSKWWELCTPREIVQFQLFVCELSMPFGEYHKALEAALGRPVWTHELGLNYDGLVEEFLGNRPPPTMEEIINLIPESKRVVVFKAE